IFLNRWGVGGAVLLEPANRGDPGFQLGAEAGSFGTYGGWGSGRLRGGDLASDGVEIVSSYSFRHGQSKNDFTYRDDRGTGLNPDDDVTSTRQNADWSYNDAWALSQLSWRSRYGVSFLKMVANAYQREQGVASSALRQTTESRSAYQREVFGLSGRFPCRIGNKGCRVEMALSYLRARRVLSDPLGELYLSADSLAQVGQRASASFGVTLDWDDELSTTLRASIEESFLNLNQPGQILNDASQEYMVATADVQYRGWGPWEAVGAFRGSCQFGRAEGLDGDQQGQECRPEGRAGLLFRVTDSLQFRSNAQYSLRYPTLADRYGVSASVRGADNLQSEKAWNFDLGAKWMSDAARWGSLHLDIAGFGRWTRDLIIYRRAALGYVRPANEEQARFFGAEGAWGGELWNHLRLEGAASYTSAEVVDDDGQNRRVPYRARTLFSQGVEFFWSLPGGFWGEEAIGLQFNHRGNRTADPAGLIIIPAANTLDIQFRQRLAFEHLVFRFRGQNLTGASNFDFLGFPLPRQSFSASLEWLQ
ncbi:MAG: TonB-dependent receptor, partial [Polyangiaceae bacterium]|nr:TonB-dependent receptor [Polyangiaceae bacterium]